MMSDFPGKSLRLVLSAGLVWSGVVLAQTGPSAPRGMPVADVGVVEMHKQEVPRTITLPGRAVAYQQVDIRPRVDGVITEILYTPGKKLEVGTPMFRLDDASYVEDVASAEADLNKAKASLPVAQAAYDRAKKLKGSGYTQAQVESAEYDLAEAKATLNAAEAALKFAKTQLSWTLITSPIQGFAEVADVSVGDLVTAAQSDALTTVTRLDPIDVNVMASSAHMLGVRRQIESGVLKMNTRLEARIKLENGEIYHGAGMLIAPSATVSTTTGTVDVRFRLENPDRLILPGMFLRGQITFGTMDAYLVPQRATTIETGGDMYVYIVDADDKSKKVELKSIGEYQNSWIVTDGLDEGDRLIVDGLKNMRAGTAVHPVAAKVDKDGLVEDVGGTDASAESGTTDDDATTGTTE